MSLGLCVAEGSGLCVARSSLVVLVLSLALFTEKSDGLATCGARYADPVLRSEYTPAFRCSGWGNGDSLANVEARSCLGLNSTLQPSVRTGGVPSYANTPQPFPAAASARASPPAAMSVGEGSSCALAWPAAGG
jgi:hypothetical protein